MAFDTACTQAQAPKFPFRCTNTRGICAKVAPSPVLSLYESVICHSDRGRIRPAETLSQYSPIASPFRTFGVHDLLDHFTSRYDIHGVGRFQIAYNISDNFHRQIRKTSASSAFRFGGGGLRESPFNRRVGGSSSTGPVGFVHCCVTIYFKKSLINARNMS